MEDQNEKVETTETMSSSIPATLVMSDKVRAQLHEKYQLVEEKLASLKKITKTAVKTNGQFKYTPDGNRVASNIHQEQDVAVLLGIYGFIMQKEEYYLAAAKATNLEAVGFPPFTWLGYPAKDWLADVEIRLSVISYKEEYERLSKIKSQLSEFFLPEDKLLQLFETLKDF